MQRAEPRLHAEGPRGDRKRGAAQAITVSSLGINVQFRRDLGILEREEIDHRVFDMHRVVLRLNDKRRRGLVGRVNVGIGSEVLLRERQIAGVDDHGEVGTAA